MTARSGVQRCKSKYSSVTTGSVLNLLQHRQWMALSDVVKHFAAEIKPEQAAKYYRMYNNYNARPRKSPPVSYAVQVARGKTQIPSHVVHSMIHKGLVEATYEKRPGGRGRDIIMSVRRID